jgi:class 3 adenylate cyclase
MRRIVLSGRLCTYAFISLCKGLIAVGVTARALAFAKGLSADRKRGAELLMIEGRVNRRLAAILAADVVGFSRLMGADEAGTLAALKRHREAIFNPAVAAHNGRIVKLIGDGVIAEFGSVVDAVSCALSVQRSSATTPDQSASALRRSRDSGRDDNISAVERAGLGGLNEGQVIEYEEVSNTGQIRRPQYAHEREITS